MNIIIGKLGKSVKFKNMIISTGDDACMVFYSTMARMLPEHNFYLVGPNYLDALSEDEYNFIFPNKNVHSIAVKYDKLPPKYTEEQFRHFVDNHVNTSDIELTDEDFKKNVIFWDSLIKHVKSLNIKFDFALLFTGYVGNHALNLTCHDDTGHFNQTLNAFVRYVGPYVHVVNTLNIPLYTIAEDPRYITINTAELFNRERLVLTQMRDGEVRVTQKYITSYSDHTYIRNTKIPCTYAGVEKIFLMAIDKNWKDKIDIERKINNKTNPKCIVLSNGHGAGLVNRGATIPDGRLPGYLEYIINGLKKTPYENTKIYGKWSDEVLEKYKDNIQDVKMIDLKDEIADAKYSFVYSVIPNFITIKPYEMIVQGLIPFIHPEYDNDRLLGIPEYCYVKDPRDLANKMAELDADDAKYRELLEQCMNVIKPEDLDGSKLINTVMKKIADNMGFEYEYHAGVPPILNHFK